jgi:phosphoglycerate dehydrogenase-like enzyme
MIQFFPKDGLKASDLGLNGESEAISMKVLFSGRFEEQVVKGVEKEWEVKWLHPKEGQWGLTEAELISELPDVDVLVSEADTVTARVFSSLTNLKAVVATRGNPVNVEVPAATAEGVLVAYAPGRNAQAVAELCIAMMVMVARNVVPAMEALRTGQWASAPRAWAYRTFQGYELGGRTAGLVGLGAVARLVAKRLAAFGMKVLAYDPYVSPVSADSVGAQLVPLEELLKEADFISMHVHVTDETREMIGKQEFALMKSTAFFINTGRAGAVEEKAMMGALEQKRIAGAALDVYHHEPLGVDSPLLSFSNVVLLPHIGGATQDVVKHQSAIAEANLKALGSGRVPPYLFNPEVLKSSRLRMAFKAE